MKIKGIRKHNIEVWIKSALGAVIIAMVLCLGKSLAYANEDVKEALMCTITIPPDFKPEKEKGLFVNVNYPMESSIIRFNAYDNGKDKVLTNREKIALEESGGNTDISDPTKLTKDSYEELMSSAYNSEYGLDVGYKVSSFEKSVFDGHPGFIISGNYQAPEEERIYQTTYIIVSKYRVFTITLQRAEDDDCQELFDYISSTISVS
ncbi:hypothetical protein [Butyrivibrio sp. VCB2006]|uniref:hypothetical protein n=1 Tax=Butyrivibrio sp. VCB2006 TaxID=1280679 RepID=UPI0004924C0B|nr:hypothetical protein [Butyrivibrio sp. VCB2006]